MKKTGLFFLFVLLCGCSARQVTDEYMGATSQRLTSLSIHGLIKSLPEKDFNKIKDSTVYINCFFLHNISPITYARKRLEVELMDKYNCRIVTNPSDARVKINVYFTSIGTDRDKFGFSLPDLVLPGLGGIMGIDILALEMFHGITEIYYYFIDENDRVTAKAPPIKCIVRNDTLKLPFFSIPVNTID